MLGAVRLSRPHTVWRARRALARLLAARTIRRRRLPPGMAVRDLRSGRSGAPGCRWCSGCTPAATAGTGSSDGRARLTPDLAVANSQFTARNCRGWFPGAPVETVYYPLRLAHTAIAPISARARHPPLAGHPAGRSRDRAGRPAGAVEGKSRSARGAGHACATWTAGRTGSSADHSAPPTSGTSASCRTWRERQGISDRVRFAGERRDVHRAPAGGRHLLPAEHRVPKPFGITLVEAQAAGLPIVTSALGGALEIVDDTLRAARRLLATSTRSRRRCGACSATTPARSDSARPRRERSSALCDLTRQMQRTHDVLSSVRARAIGIAAAARVGPS